MPTRGAETAEIRLRDRWGRLGSRQGDHHRVARPTLPLPRSPRRPPEARPLRERRPGDDEPVRARRGVRARRRRRDRPGPRPLRALHRREPPPRLEPDDRRRLQLRDRQGAPGRLPGQDRAGDPAHHRRDQGPDPQPRRRRERGPRDRRGRRDGRRHRIAPVPGGDPPAPQRGGPRPVRVRPRQPDAVHRALRRAEDQAHAALGQGAAFARPAARRDRVPFGPADRAPPEGEDQPAVRRADQRRGLGPGLGLDLPGPADPGEGGARHGARAAPADRRPARHVRMADARRPDRRRRRPGARGDRRQVREPARRLPVGDRGPQARRVPPRRRRPDRLGVLRRRRRGRRRPDPARRAGHRGARGVRVARRRGQAGGRPVRARTRRAVPRALPGAPVRGDRVRAQRLRPGGRQLLRVRPGHAAPGDRPAARTEGRDRPRRLDAPGRAAVPPRAGDPRGAGLRRARRVRTPSPPVRGQPRVPRGALGQGSRVLGPVAGRPPRRDHRARGSPVLHGGSVPPRAPVATDAAAPVVPRVRRRREDRSRPPGRSTRSRCRARLHLLGGGRWATWSVRRPGTRAAAT